LEDRFALNDGVLGEQLALQTLNEKTGLNFKPLQSSSNHGCDGCVVAINGDRITVVVMDAKSSVNGVSKAGTPHGDPATRLSGWLGNSSLPIRTRRYVMLCEQRCFLKTSKSKA
jgi:filamentous hemagglutinin